jgi:hypothetical protein
MSELRISQEKVIQAPAAIVYEVLADYREHHHRVLPESFVDFKVESGGRGAGTVMTFKTKNGGLTRSWRGVASEPEPGRRLVETYDNGTVTTFYVDPVDGGTRLRIETVWTPKGLQGLVERLLAPSMLKGVYVKELDNIDAYARSLNSQA